ncbi:hypothetical protein PIB30_087492 [Stylosanthes scabra]|uniref:CCHC-type domain-containing protein n=1 Tax=Stylosanthes scabra TaxID=79078 RepID=A0ABU6VWM3_9FABA|nr:hypothetical protein [Stylosanthes scabra]
MTILESQGRENKKKSLDLKALSSHDEESDDEEEDQDFKLLIKKFTKFAKRENLIPKKQNKPSKCFECGEIGHIKLNCPKLQKGEKYKKLKKKQKAYMSWENEDNSSTDSDDDEVANICLMANNEKSIVDIVFKPRKARIDSEERRNRNRFQYSRIDSGTQNLNFVCRWSLRIDSNVPESIPEC